MAKKVRIAIVGLGFGAEFIPIYQNHPEAELVAVCQRNPKKLRAIQQAFGIPRGYADYAALLRDPEIDAVHINTPIPDHARQTLAALGAGKHVACTVPMATSLADCRRIVALSRKQRRKYMMMETVVYAREFLFIRTSSNAARSASCSSCRRATSRTWTAGRTTGRGFRRCGTPRTASGRCWA